MSVLTDEQTLQSLADTVEPNGRIVRAWPLHGGISFATTALRIQRSDGTLTTCVVREADTEVLARRPHAVEDEYRLLEITHAYGLPSPKPLLLHRRAPASPANCMVLEFIDGTPMVKARDPRDCARQFAQHLAAIHAIAAPFAHLDFLDDGWESIRNWLRHPPTQLDENLCEADVRGALNQAAPKDPYRNGSVLLHGDFWPGNVLSRDQRIVGIIDWEDAIRGDPGIDVSITRLDLMWAYGVEAMHEFTETYRRISGVDLSDLAFWDLCAALRPMGSLQEWAQGWPAMGRADISIATMMADHRQFTQAALRAL